MIPQPMTLADIVRTSAMVGWSFEYNAVMMTYQTTWTRTEGLVMESAPKDLVTIRLSDLPAHLDDISSEIRAILEPLVPKIEWLKEQAINTRDNMMPE